MIGQYQYYKPMNLSNFIGSGIDKNFEIAVGPLLLVRNGSMKDKISLQISIARVMTVNHNKTVTGQIRILIRSKYR